VLNSWRKRRKVLAGYCAAYRDFVVTGSSPRTALREALPRNWRRFSPIARRIGERVPPGVQCRIGAIAPDEDRRRCNASGTAGSWLHLCEGFGSPPSDTGSEEGATREPPRVPGRDELSLNRLPIPLVSVEADVKRWLSPVVPAQAGTLTPQQVDVAGPALTETLVVMGSPACAGTTSAGFVPRTLEHAQDSRFSW
jgi:hypothetical protein